ncbi:MAG: hypothetical protein Q9182_001925 [Xanthomendoza sp. 2 TL-2023]
MAKRSREDTSPLGSRDPPSASSSSSHPGSPSVSAVLDESHSTKYLHVSDEPARACVAMKCSLAPHPDTITFNTFKDFEVHYAQYHSNRCSECHKNFPTEHFLGLHISENHDPLVAARKVREEKTKRKMHLQAKHFFPKEYDFFIVNNGIDKRSSMLRTRHRRGSSAASRALHRNQNPAGLSHQPPSLKDNDQTPEYEGNQSLPDPFTDNPDESFARKSPTSPIGDIDELTSSMSAFTFVPRSVRFGRGGRAAGFSRR